MIYSYKSHIPNISSEAILLEPVTIAGNVTIGKHVNIWFNAVIRGDINSVQIGDKTNIQDATIIHVDTRYPTCIGKGVTIGHGAIIHGCTIADHTLIGMGAILLNGCSIEEGAIVAAGAVVREGFQVPARTLVAGVPAKIMRNVTDDEYQAILDSANHYIEISQNYIQHI